MTGNELSCEAAKLAERIANETNERAAEMTPEERARADSKTKKIADRVQPLS